MSDETRSNILEHQGPEGVERWVRFREVGYAIDPYGREGDDRLWVWPPGILGCFPLDDRWTWELHDDGTVTVNPSIGVGKDMADYHGWLRRGEWTSA
mgnify:CR=1 FL=1